MIKTNMIFTSNSSHITFCIALHFELKKVTNKRGTKVLKMHITGPFTTKMKLRYFLSRFSYHISLISSKNLSHEIRNK